MSVAFALAFSAYGDCDNNANGVAASKLMDASYTLADFIDAKLNRLEAIVTQVEQLQEKDDDQSLEELQKLGEEFQNIMMELQKINPEDVTNRQKKRAQKIMSRTYGL